MRCVMLTGEEMKTVTRVQFLEEGEYFLKFDSDVPTNFPRQRKNDRLTHSHYIGRCQNLTLCS